MTSRPIQKLVVALAILALAATSCAPSYQFKPIPIRPIGGYPNRAEFPEGLVGAVAFYESDQLTEIFGFDLKKAGVIPVQVRLENHSPDARLVVVESIVTDDRGRSWEVLPSDVVFDRIDKYTRGGLSGEQGVRRTLLWGLAGGIIGAAVGVATGTNVGTAAGKGAAIGGALGASTSIMSPSIDDGSNAMDIQRDFSGRSLDHASIPPERVANGLFYFPAESGRPVHLTLVVKAGDATRQFELPL